MIKNVIDSENMDELEWNLFGKWMFGYALNVIKERYDEYVELVDRQIWNEITINSESVIQEALEKFCDNISDN